MKNISIGITPGSKITGASVALIVTLIGSNAAANISSTRWIHQLTQEGQNVRITISVYEESTDELVYDTFDFPGLATPYTVSRVIGGPQETIVDNRIFTAEEAIEVTDLVCHGNEGAETECTEECEGFCAVAYRYELVDECAPVGESFYKITIPAIANDPNWAGEGLGMASIVVEDYAGDSCFDDDTGICSVTAVGQRPVGGLVALTLLALGFVLARRQQ